MPTYRCLIIEDDDVAQQFLRNYLKRLPHLEVVSVFTNPLDALPTLYNNEIDLLFLDMHLPGMDGLDFLSSLKNPPKVVLTTADPAYALNAYEAGVTDYLVKPYTFERLLKAVNRAISGVAATTGSIPRHIFLKTGRESVRVVISEILYAEALGALSKVYTSTTVLVVSELLADLHEQLPPGEFIRVHKSYIVARQCISKISSKFISVQQYQIPIGATYRNQVENLIQVNR
ncbi:LytR/AlgR family response regulator transcription factor [Spirosoma utsteinense]|uniref:DNA-binding LytR/AlgR family response regulator n=1 Tax=Spirosoma utsteinense TaxID=2585773 RepID=A0ABR6WCP7_9BACT|nr:LytTR family DNA-binding domain-containing protein [Spirosoma utsteinense]MBC3785765.1 DNA-binding LytR/AlgR family response regulator [Spirosoma utsteinense]MBC3793707.1 DNA-binding LytR/AlgR family response regulator [Spirosoma utsteinense]